MRGDGGKMIRTQWFVINILVVALVLQVVIVGPIIGNSQETKWDGYSMNGILFTPDKWAYPTTLYTPIQVQDDMLIPLDQNSWIAKGKGRFVKYKFGEYTGNENLEEWSWIVSDIIADIEGSLGREPSIGVRLRFEPFYPEPPSAVAARSVNNVKSEETLTDKPISDLVITGCFTWPYLTPRMLNLLKNTAMEDVTTPLGTIKSYKIGFEKPARDKLPSLALLPLCYRISVGGLNSRVYWYDGATGVLVKAEIRTNKGETLTFLINKTNIEGLVTASMEQSEKQ